LKIKSSFTRRIHLLFLLQDQRPHPQSILLLPSTPKKKYTIHSHRPTYSHKKKTYTMSPIDSPAVPNGSLVVVTGATGFIGSHISDQFLQRGYKVRATTRGPSKNTQGSSSGNSHRNRREPQPGPERRHPRDHRDGAERHALRCQGALGQALRAYLVVCRRVGELGRQAGHGDCG
jgi:hypothetical protein